MRPVNLIPPEERRGERAPLRTGPLAYILVAVLLLAFAGVYAVVSTGNSISEREASVVALDRELSSAQARAEALSSFTDFASLEQSRTATVTSLAQSRFDWERVLRELALVIPEDVSLDSLTGSTASGSAGEAAGGSSIGAPSLDMTGCAGAQESVAGMLSALRDIDGVTRVGLSSSARTEDGSSASSVAGESAGTGATDCQGYAFTITVAFDEAAVDATAAGAEASPETIDPSAVSEEQEARSQGQDAVDSAQDQSQEAVNDYVPGA